MNTFDQQSKKNSIETITVPVAQWIARWTSNPKVPGSNPGRDTKIILMLIIIKVINVSQHDRARDYEMA